MKEDFLIVVGDRFCDFAENDQNIMVVSGFKDKLLRKEISATDVFIGQGVTPEALIFLQALVKNTPISLHASPLRAREDRTFVHKHRQENVVISIPQKIDTGLFESFLVVDERCAEMQDHVTGWHLQGMLLVESMRQMMTAVVERFYLTEAQRNRMYFILDGISIDFKQFAFPVEVKIAFKMGDLRQISDLGFKASAFVEFTQANREIAEAKIRFSILQKQFSSRIEQKAMKETVQHYVKPFSELT